MQKLVRLDLTSYGIVCAPRIPGCIFASRCTLRTLYESVMMPTVISNQQWKMLTVGIRGMVGMYAISWGALSAVVVVATVPILAIYLLMSGEIQKSFSAGAQKG